MATRVNQLNFANRGTSPFSFDGGVCDTAIVKTSNNSGGVGNVFYNGLYMSVIGFVNDTAGWTHQIWALQNAPQGVVTVQVTGGGTIFESVESYSGISTTASFPHAEAHEEHHFGVGANDNIRVSVTTSVDDCILIGLGGYQGPGLTYMFGGDKTNVISHNPSSGGNDLSLESSPLDVGVAGTYHLEGNTGGGSNGIVLSLVVCALAPGPAAVKKVITEVLVIGGGGSGSRAVGPGHADVYGAGGGAGQYQHQPNVQLSVGSYPVVVGKGALGVGPGSTNVPGNTGGTSSFNTPVMVAIGGQGGDEFGFGGRSGSGFPGGTPSPRDSNPMLFGEEAGGGGGGGSGPGGNGSHVSSNAVGGDAGNGVTSSIAGFAAMYVVGGAGAGATSNGDAKGGGGTGAGQGQNAGNGNPNTGNGGGGSGHTGFAGSTGNGGDGVVIIRYFTSDYADGFSISGGTITTDGLYTVHTFTADGNFVVSFSSPSQSPSASVSPSASASPSLFPNTPFIDVTETHAIAVDQADVHIDFTVPSGVPRPVLAILINSQQFSEPDSVKWNGVSLAKLDTGLSQNFFCSVFYIVDPQPGEFDLHLHWPSAEREAIVTIIVAGNTRSPVYIPKTDGDDNQTWFNLFFIGNATTPDHMEVGFVMSEATTHVSTTGETQVSNAPSFSGTYRQSVWSHQHAGSQGQETMGVGFGAVVKYQFKMIEFPLFTETSSLSPSASKSPSSSASASVSQSVSISPSASASPSPGSISNADFLIMF